MWRFAVGLLAVTVFAPSLPAQTAREQVRDLFHFGSCATLICLQNAEAGRHGTHYNPDADASAQELIDFLTNAISVGVSNIPLGSTSGGTVFTFNESGVPVATSVSAGPVFGERAQTLGRRRVLIGVNVVGSKFESLRGVDLSNLGLTLTHQDVGAIHGDSLGDPAFEFDTIQIRTAMEASLSTYSFFLSYGLTDRLDVGVGVPIVHLSVSGTSIGTIFNTTGTELHYFEGTPPNAQVVDTARSSVSRTGIGDVAARLKFNIFQSLGAGAALLADVRLPTGDEDNLLGSGDVSARGLGIISAQFGRVSPHLNAGYLYRSGETENSAILGTVGVDALAGSRVTVAADVIGQWQVGENKLTLPPAAVYLNGTTLRRTPIPDKRDDLVWGSAGAKVSLVRDFTVVGNVIFPFTDGGLRPNVIWTAGLEANF